MSVVTSTRLKTPSGDLELLSCHPESDSSNPAILCLHGAFCSAHDYQFLLPYFASRGFPVYSLSLRGHGESWAPSTLGMHLTSLDHHADDIGLALNHVSEKHSGSPLAPVLVGHSLGGGYLQYFLSRLNKASNAHPEQEPRASAIVLLGSAPLSGGGKDIMAHWEAIETQGKGYKYPWSPRSQLDTISQVREVFFQESTPEDTIEKWQRECRTKAEGIRAGLAVLWPFGKASDVLAALGGIHKDGVVRKMLHVAAARDRLVLPSMVTDNVLAYRKAIVPETDAELIISSAVIPESAHHLIMDIAWQHCAETIVDWIEWKDNKTS